MINHKKKQAVIVAIVIKLPIHVSSSLRDFILISAGRFKTKYGFKWIYPIL